jgi:hypothetical protein
MITVTTPATNFNLIDVSLVRTALGIVDQADDPALQGFVDRASDVIARYCRRDFALETVDETFRLDRCQLELILSRYPVDEITSVVENGTTLDADRYEVDKAKGFLSRLHTDRRCFWSPCKIVVTYTAGYDLPTDTPEALKQAAVQLVKSYYMGADRDPMVRSESVEALSSASYFSTGDDPLPPDVKGLLLQFKNVKAR